METTEYKPTYEQLEAALTIAQYAIKRVYKPTAELQSLSIDLAQIDKVLAPPPPTYKEVTVERWECDECGKVYDSHNEGSFCGAGSDGCECESTNFTKLIGTRRVPVKQPVRKTLSGKVGPFGLSFDTEIEWPPVDTRFTLRWEE